MREKEIQGRLACFHEPEFRPVWNRSRALRERLGNSVPCDHPVLKIALAWATRDFTTQSAEMVTLAQHLLLWLAGPYREHKQWLLAESVRPELTTDALLARCNERGLITDQDVTETLCTVGVRQVHHEAWIAAFHPLRQVKDGLLYWGRSFRDKAESLLRYYGRPMTAEEMQEVVSVGNVRKATQCLMKEPGFWRINAQGEFVLSGTPGYQEYKGVADLIVRELKVCRGQARIDHLVNVLSWMYGVAKASVIDSLQGPEFIKRPQDTIQLRTEGTSNPRAAVPLAETANCYRNRDGVWGWCLLIEPETMHGRGCSMPNAFAHELGCTAGDKIRVPSEYGPITVDWPRDNGAGPSTGSLRTALVGCGAQPGDYVFVRATEPRISFERLNQHSLQTTPSKVIHLGLLLGCPAPLDEAEVLVDIANALCISTSSADAVCQEAYQVLQARNEIELAALIAPVQHESPHDLPGSSGSVVPEEEKEQPDTLGRLPPGWVQLMALDMKQVTGRNAPSCIRFPDGCEYPVEYWYQLVLHTVMWLCARGVLSRDNVPVASGKKRYIVHIQPRHLSGHDFWSPEEIEGLWVEKRISTIQAINNIAKLMAHCNQDSREVLLRWRSEPPVSINGTTGAQASPQFVGQSSAEGDSTHTGDETSAGRRTVRATPESQTQRIPSRALSKVPRSAAPGRSQSMGVPPGWIRLADLDAGQATRRVPPTSIMFPNGHIYMPWIVGTNWYPTR